MNNTFSLQQISRTSNLDSILISRQYKLNLTADFMRVNYENPKLKQSEIANQLGCSTNTLQRYRNDINMLHHTEFTRITPINEQKTLKILILTTIHTVTMTSKDLKRPQWSSNGKKVKTKKNNSKFGSVHEIIEIKDQYLDEISDNNDI